MSDPFVATAFQSLIALDAILFGVLGFLYSTYAMYSSLATPEEPARAPICATLTFLCRLLAILLILLAVPVLYALYAVVPAQNPGVALGWGLALAVAAMAVIAGWLSFVDM